MITNIPTHLELKYSPDPNWGWYINVPEAYPMDLIAGWIKKVAYPMMYKRVAQLPPGDLRDQMTKVLPDLFNCKVKQHITKPGFDLFKSNEKQTKTLFHYN